MTYRDCYLDFLDLDKETLFGFQELVFDSLIGSMAIGIRHGDVFPPADVFKLNGAYYLCDVRFRKEYGSHHKAVAHYIEGEPFKVLVYDISDIRPSHLQDFLPISQIEIVTDFNMVELKEMIKDDPKYRPLKHHNQLKQITQNQSNN